MRVKRHAATVLSFVCIGIAARAFWRSLGRESKATKATDSSAILVTLPNYPELQRLTRELEEVTELGAELSNETAAASAAAEPGRSQPRSLLEILRPVRKLRARDLESMSQLNEHGGALSEQASRQLENVCGVFDYRRAALLRYRSELINGRFDSLVAQGALRIARYRTDSPTQSYLRSYAKKHPGVLAVHMNPELYEGGEDFAAWHVYGGNLWLMTYGAIPELRVLDVYFVDMQKRFLSDLVEVFAVSGRLTPRSAGSLLDHISQMVVGPP